MSINLHCSFCGQDPQSIFHVILDCTFVNQLWSDLTPVLLKIDPTPVSDVEKAFGILSQTPKATLRNWLTHNLRELIETQEKQAYYNHNYIRNIAEFKRKYNAKLEKRLHQVCRSYQQSGNIDAFDKYFRIGDVLLTPTDEDEASFNHPYQTP